MRAKSRELLPLPYPPITPLAQVEMQQLFTQGPLCKAALTAGANSWLWCVIMAINYMDSRQGVDTPHWCDATEPQKKAIEALLEQCHHFVKDEKPQTPKSWWDELGRK